MLRFVLGLFILLGVGKAQPSDHSIDSKDLLSKLKCYFGLSPLENLDERIPRAASQVWGVLFHEWFQIGIRNPEVLTSIALSHLSQVYGDDIEFMDQYASTIATLAVKQMVSLQCKMSYLD